MCAHAEQEEGKGVGRACVEHSATQHSVLRGMCPYRKPLLLRPCAEHTAAGLWSGWHERSKWQGHHADAGKLRHFFCAAGCCLGAQTVGACSQFV